MPEGFFTRSSRRVLEPIDRVSEVLFGLIMVLTFTGSLSVAEAGRENIRTMLIGALGCNLAWGIIDGVLYMMGCLADRGRGLLMFHAVRKATDPKKAQRLIADALPPVIASILEPAELETMHRRLQQLPEPPGKARLGKEDWLGALGVFLLVFLGFVLHLYRSYLPGICAAYLDRGPRLSASRNAIQLRKPRNGIGMGRLQFLRRRKTGVGIHADAGRRIRQYDWHRARLQVFACLLEIRPFQ